MDPTALGSSPGSVPRHLMLEVGTSSQAFRGWLKAPHYPRTRVTQGICDTWGISKWLWRCIDVSWVSKAVSVYPKQSLDLKAKLSLGGLGPP